MMSCSVRRHAEGTERPTQYGMPPFCSTEAFLQQFKQISVSGASSATAPPFQGASPQSDKYNIHTPAGYGFCLISFAPSGSSFANKFALFEPYRYNIKNGRGFGRN